MPFYGKRRGCVKTSDFGTSNPSGQSRNQGYDETYNCRFQLKEFNSQIFWIILGFTGGYQGII